MQQLARLVRDARVRGGHGDPHLLLAAADHERARLRALVRLEEAREEVGDRRLLRARARARARARVRGQG